MLYVTHSVAEAVALGSRLFLLERGKIVADGPPLDILAAARRSDDGSIPFEGVLNVFAARIEDHAPGHNATRLHLDDGPELIVGFLDRPAGSPLLVEIRADDILLARHPVSGLSARNQIPGIVERIVPRGRHPHRRTRLDRQPRRPGGGAARAGARGRGPDDRQGAGLVT